MVRKKIMHVCLLGTAAGGGFPQWNCNCHNCRGVRTGKLRTHTRTQSCVAISADGAHWFLLNASPDIRIQIEAFSPLTPSDSTRRGSPIAAILLTDADLDHTLGLFLLREGLPQIIYSTTTVRSALTEGLSLFPVLSSYCGVQWHEASSVETQLLYADGSSSGIRYKAFPLPDKPPRYMRGHSSTDTGDRIGYLFQDERTGGRLVFMPGVSALNETLLAYLQDCDALLLDGTFWDEQEMQHAVGATTSASQMGHLPVGGSGGSLEQIASLPIRHKIYTHINNTNPMLIDDAPERLAVEAAGITIGWDGLEIHL